MTSLFAWIEVPVSDFTRAREFYEGLLGLPITEHDLDGVKHGFWENTDNSVGGAIVTEGTPSKTGPLVYFDGGDDLQNFLNKIPSLGGAIVLEKSLITPEIGYYAIFIDTEGNRFAFWSSK